MIETSQVSSRISLAETTAYSRQRLAGFEIHHASQLAEELGRLARKTEKSRFEIHRVASVRLNGNGMKIPDVALNIPMLRVTGVGDVLSRDWIILSDGRVLTCDTILLMPDVLDIGTLSYPNPKDLINDQKRIFERIIQSQQPIDNERDGYKVPKNFIKNLMARYTSKNPSIANQ